MARTDDNHESLSEFGQGHATYRFIPIRVVAPLVAQGAPRAQYVKNVIQACNGISLFGRLSRNVANIESIVQVLWLIIMSCDYGNYNYI